MTGNNHHLLLCVLCVSRVALARSRSLTCSVLSG
jgi:hypothetical protein